MQIGQRKLAAIMFTDFVGYSKVTHQNEPLALELLAEHRVIIERLVTEFRGRVIQTVGDGFLLEFGSALEASRCAIEIQNAFRARNQGLQKERTIHVRVGIHLGDILSGEKDIYGDGVNIAARLHALAKPGGICLSQQIYDQVVGQLGANLYRLGRRQLKNIREPMMTYLLDSAPTPSVWRPVRQVRVAMEGFFLLPWPALVGGTGLGIALVVGLSLYYSGNISSPGLGSVKRVAILPFTSIGLKTEDEFISEGMTEEIISSLSALKNVRVLARSSVARFQGSSQSMGDIGKELGVATLVEGKVMKSGERLRISARIIDVSSQEYVWSQDFDGGTEKLFEIQKKISSRVAQQLKGREIAAVQPTSEESSGSKHGAYVQYLRGRHFFERRTRENLEKAIEYFKKSINEAPDFAPSYGALANALHLMAFYGFLDPREAYPKGMEYATKALTLDSRSQEAYLFLAEKNMTFDRNWRESESNFKKAIEINPNLSTAHQWYSDLLVALLRFEEAKKEAMKAQELEPLSLAVSISSGKMRYYWMENEEALTIYRGAIELDPNFAIAYYWQGLAQIQKQEFEKGLASLEKASSLNPGSWMMKAGLAYGLGKSGRNSEAVKILGALKEASKKEYVSPYLIAEVYSGLGDFGAAYMELMRGVNEKTNHMTWLGVDPIFAPLRKEPRWKLLAGALHLPTKAH